ncbi:MAG: hypothetical protein ABL927_03090 [Bdellovibrionales bacterium]
MTSDKQFSWNAFFSSLAAAEHAAAVQCQQIAALFRKAKRFDLEQIYLKFSEEETGHFETVSSLINSEIEITPKARYVYAGKLMRRQDCVLEKMAIVHLAFEPSALAFLGHIHQNAEVYFKDQKYAQKVKNAFGAILKEEVFHIHTGKELICELLKTSDHVTRKNIKDSLRIHKAFLSLGLKYFFKNSEDSRAFTASMLVNYNLRFENLAQELA